MSFYCSEKDWQEGLRKFFQENKGEVAVVKLSEGNGYSYEKLKKRAGGLEPREGGVWDGHQVNGFWPPLPEKKSSTLAEIYDICEAAYGSTEFSVSPQAPQYTASATVFSETDPHLYMGPLSLKNEIGQGRSVAVICVVKGTFTFKYQPNSVEDHLEKRKAAFEKARHRDDPYHQLAQSHQSAAKTLAVAPGHVLVARMDLIHYVPKYAKDTLVVMHAPRHLLDADYLFAKLPEDMKKRKFNVYEEGVTNFEAELMGMPFGIPGFVGDLGGVRQGEFNSLPDAEEGKDSAPNFDDFEKMIWGRIDDITSRIMAKGEGYTLPRQDHGYEKIWKQNDAKQDEAIKKMQGMDVKRIIEFWKKNWSRRTVDVEAYFKSGAGGAMYNCQASPLSNSELEEVKGSEIGELPYPSKSFNKV